MLYSTKQIVVLFYSMWINTLVTCPPSLLALLLGLLFLQALDQFLSDKRAQAQATFVSTAYIDQMNKDANLHAVVRQWTVGAARLQLARDLTRAVDLDTSQNILRPSDSTKFGWVSAVAQMNKRSDTCTSGAALPTCALRLRAGTLATGVAPSRTDLKGGRSGKRAGLAYNIFVKMTIFSNDLIKNLQKALVLRKAPGRGRHLCSRAYG